MLKQFFFFGLCLSLASAAAWSAEPAPARKPVLFIVGDSTVNAGKSGPAMGWGDCIGRFFDKSKIDVRNKAVGGRSSRTFQTEGLWDKILEASNAGDFVLVQMGHNDGGPLDDTKRARGSIPGTGDESKEIDNPITKKKEVVHTYGWYMRKYVTDARAKGMTVIICSPVPHVPKDKVEPGAVEASRYVKWSAEIAKDQQALFIDLNRNSMAHYAGMTPETIKAKYFVAADNTHSSSAGADLNALAVVEGIKTLKD